ncbi:MAG: hypothetical protein U0836_15315 [Pirellulales bacterium]
MRLLAFAALLVALSLAGLSWAQEKSDPSADDAAARKVVDEAKAENHDQTALEKEFQQTMSGATLVGHFTVSGLPGGGPLKEERYKIKKVSKLTGNWWVLLTSVEYGGKKEVTVPVPLQVNWAGDTPVITLTDVPIPRLGTFTSRVLVYKGEYAGTWSGGDHGGHLFGRIEPAGGDEKAKAETK